jgi:hypothetical protein
MGDTNNVSVSLMAFSPICFDSVPLMCLPYSFFEFRITNTGTSSVDAAIAFQIPTGSVPTFVSGKGIQSSASDALNRAVYASSSNSSAVISAGSDNGFTTSGVCSNTPSGTLNKVAVKVTLAAQATDTIRFVYAWYNGSSNSYSVDDPWASWVLGYNITYTGTIGPDRLYYTNLVSGAGDVADIGLAQFARLRANALNIVTSMRASSIPYWIKDQTLNSLCNLTSNSIYTKDGRLCYTEGEWNTNGTMDQMWHAREIVTMTVPSLAWQELKWWARTQKTVDSAVGQIHHDMGAPTQRLYSWDTANHLEYTYQPNCNPWVDLNVGFIISVYEAYIATGNKTQLDSFWVYVKKADQRIFDQVTKYGNTSYPYTFSSSLNTYDQVGLDLNAFNSGLSTVAYKIMVELATLYNDTALAKKNQNAFDTSKISFEKKYLTSNFPSGTRFNESVLAGQWIAFYLKFGQLYSTSGLNYGLKVEDTTYKAVSQGLPYTTKTYEEWAPYLISHYGGLRLMTDSTEIWYALQHDWYERNYLNRNLVFNQPLDIPAKVTSATYLATDASTYNQYISTPVLWRNYYTIIGYHRNKPTGELWLEPIMTSEMNHTMSKAFYISPEGAGTISYTESGTNYRSQSITFKPDSTISVTYLYVWDKDTADTFQVRVNGQVMSATRTGSGYAKELKVAYNGTVSSSTGLAVSVLYGSDTAGIRYSREKSTSLKMTRKMFAGPDGKLVFPKTYSGKDKAVTVYSLSGARLCHKVVRKDAVDLSKDFGISRGTYIVKVKVE